MDFLKVYSILRAVYGKVGLIFGLIIISSAIIIYVWLYHMGFVVFKEETYGSVPRATNHMNVVQSEVKGSIMKRQLLLSPKQLSAIKDRHDARMAHVRNVCKSSNYSKIPSLLQWKTLSRDRRLSFCLIPKSGSTFLSVKLKNTIEKIKRDYRSFQEKKRKRFVLVREPYSRLVSAYFSKIVGHPEWWTVLGGIILAPFRPNHTKNDLICGHDVTFPETVKYAIRMHRSGFGKDGHFLRIMDVCNVCADMPDFIGKLENVSEDMAYILNSVNITAKTDEVYIELQANARRFMNKFYEFFKESDCGPMCPLLKRFWWAQQATGYISLDIDFPLEGPDCDNVSRDKLEGLAWMAYRMSSKYINSQEQRMKVKTDLFRQVPLKDRNELERLFTPECKLFGYDPHPKFVFPEK